MDPSPRKLGSSGQEILRLLDSIEKRHGRMHCNSTPSLACMASQDASCSCTYGVCVNPLVCQVNVNEIHGLYDKW